MPRAVIRDPIAGFDLANPKRRDTCFHIASLRVGAVPVGCMSKNSWTIASRAMSAEHRTGRSVLCHCGRVHAMMRSTFAAAGEQLLLRSLAKRWSNQRQGHDKQQQHSQDSTHVKLPYRILIELRNCWPYSIEGCAAAYMVYS